MRQVRIAAAFVLTVAFAGCTASRDEAEKIIKDLNDALASFTSTLEGIKDQASSKAVNAKLRTDVDKIKALKDKADKTRVTKTTESSLEKQYQQQLMQTGEKLGMQLLRIKSIPGTEAEVALAMEMLSYLAKKP